MKFYGKSIITACAALSALPLFQSCLDKGDGYIDNSYLYPNAVVTVKPVTEGENKYFYFQLDDETKLWPLDNAYHPYDGKEVRALAYISETEMPSGVDTDIYDKAVKICWMDSILTKKPVVFQSAGDDEQSSDVSDYGNDPVEIYKGFTVVEDGYLTIHFGTYWGNTGIKHEVNLLTGLNADDPYEVYFKHNAHGDVNHAPGDGFVAFRLEDLLDTGGETVELTLKFDSFSGVKTAKFNYKTRVDE